MIAAKNTHDVSADTPLSGVGGTLVDLLSAKLARRIAGTIADLAMIAAAGCLVAMLVGLAVGYRVLVVRSGSMAPVFDAGDVIISKVSSPDDVSVGDIVSFRDPSRSNRLLTHRVVKATLSGTTYAFVTRGDANTGVEKWKIRASGKVGIFRLSIPSLGWAMALLGNPWVRTGSIIAAMAIAAAMALRRIWA